MNDYCGLLVGIGWLVGLIKYIGFKIRIEIGLILCIVEAEFNLDFGLLASTMEASQM